MKDQVLVIKKMINDLDEEIIEINERRREYYNQLALIKKRIEDDNKHLIGKKAICVVYETGTEFECVCTAIKVLDDYETVKPLFTRLDGRKVFIDEYKWL